MSISPPSVLIIEEEKDLKSKEIESRIIELSLSKISLFTNNKIKTITINLKKNLKTLNTDPIILRAIILSGNKLFLINFQIF